MGSKDNAPTVAYFYDEEVCNHNYGGGNPMRPHRVRLTHSLVSGYGLDKKMLVHRPTPQTSEELTSFHADEYINFLKSVTPDNQDEFVVQMRRFNLGPVGEADCPVFDDMFDYFKTYTGGSVGGATMLNDGTADICLNWAGGMHHAKKAEASGFCYINDIVLAMLELLKVHQRVLYVDIDIHHGDGVEEAFYTTDRVMTVSFHKYGEFFPGTGHLDDVGYGRGKHYSVNVPLREGMDDESYQYLFEPIMQKVMEVYLPGAIVMCCGADSLSGDRLGCFNLSLQGHSNCIEFLARFGVPLLVLGGGGYTMRNVARCWCYETGRMLGLDLPDGLPDPSLRQYNYYDDTHRLRISVSNMKNANPVGMLEHIKTQVLERLSKLPAAPSAQFQARAPQYQRPEAPEDEMDVRGGGQHREDARRVKDHDYATDEEDDVKPQRNEADHGGAAWPPAVEGAAVAAAAQERGRSRTPPAAVKEEQPGSSLGAGVSGDATAAGAASGERGGSRRTPPPTRSRTPTPPPRAAPTHDDVKTEPSPPGSAGGGSGSGGAGGASPMEADEEAGGGGAAGEGAAGGYGDEPAAGTHAAGGASLPSGSDEGYVAALAGGGGGGAQGAAAEHEEGEEHHHPLEQEQPAGSTGEQQQYEDDPYVAPPEEQQQATADCARQQLDQLQREHDQQQQDQQQQPEQQQPPSETGGAPDWQQ